MKNAALVDQAGKEPGTKFLDLSPPSSHLLVLPLAEPNPEAEGRGPSPVDPEISLLGMERGPGRRERSHPALLDAHFIASDISGM